MNPIIIPIILKAAGLLLDPKLHQNVTNLKEAVNALLAELTPDLPEKADGKPWTQEDVDALADDIISRNEAIKARMGGSTTEPAPETTDTATDDGA